jgi:predicted ATPase/class 3 adenylate cyclase
MDHLIRLNARADGHYAFLFTDIEGSTKQWAMFPGEMGGALARLDAVLDDVVRANGGEVFKSSGDGGHALFATVPAALTAAAALQRRLNGEDFSAVGGLKLRIGVHCGPAAFRDGDYFGLTLNRTARIMAAGHGGQVLVSAAAAEAAGAGFSMRSLGVHRLKDLAQAEELFPLAGPGLAAEFPPLRALGEKPNNLPQQPNTFFGREEELAALRELLASHKLVTLLGPGGIGKTRLALQVGADALDDYTDGVFVVELAGVSEAVQVVAAAASALNITLSGGDAPAEQLASALRGAAMLIILDNCEHLIDAASGLTAAILQRNAGVTILATSRSPLGLPGEQSLALPTLPVPEAGAVAGITADGAAGFASVQLFVARAGLVQPGFALADKNAADIAAICQRLDGIALAIELAAARTRLMRPQDLLARLNDRFQLLTGGPRTNATRQQTLRATIDWSFDLLNESERVAFRRLGVFAGSFDLPGAEAVLQGGPIGALDVLDLVAGLLDKSLITRLPAEEREPRYRLLDSTRDYALEKLEQAGEKDALQRAHALQMVAVLSEVARRYPDTDTIIWRADVEPEIENLQAALAWAFGNGGDDGIAIALVARLWPLVYEDVIDWGMFRAFVRSAMKLLAPHTPREDAAMLWKGLSSDSSATARASAAPAATAQALFHDLGDRQMEALAASIAAYYLARSGDTAGAEPAANAARVILRKIKPNLISARVLYILAAHSSMAAREAADFAAVRRDYDAALQIYEKLNNQTGILEVSANLADQQASVGDYAGAIESTKRNAAENRARRAWRSLHSDLVNQTTYCLLMGDNAAAARAAWEALPHGLEPFDQGTSAAFTGSLALLAARTGALETAAKLAGHTSSIDVAHQANFQTVEQLVWDALMALFAQAENSAKLSAADRARLMDEGAALSLEAALKLAAEFLPIDG